jgi:formylglycine-generating enzyme required for sulfatase activity
MAVRRADSSAAAGRSVRPCFSVPAAQAAKRVALVIGNDTYDALPNLVNARTDARGMAKTLRKFGFEVILKLDADRLSFGRALTEFEGKAASADVGLVFYAGHGVQSNGLNYLVPSNAQVEAEDDLRFQGIEAGAFLQAMRTAGTRLNILILDACRDNPLPKRTRTAKRGLTVTAVPQGIGGTAIVYAAGQGQRAQDGPEGGHGIFTGALLQVLEQPGLKLGEVFNQTAKRVITLTNNQQRPWINRSDFSDFVFNRAKSVAPPVPPGGSAEIVFWQSIQDSQDKDAYLAYLKRYPNGTYSDLARLRIKRLKPRQTAALLPPAKPVIKLEPIEGTYVALRNANVRAAPDVNAPRVATLPKGGKVHVAGKVASKDWLAVDRDGKRLGFVYSKLLRDAEARVASVIPPKVTVPKRAKVAVGVYMSPGHVFRDCEDCPEMVVIPPGRFRMGDLNGGGRSDEKPVHDVRIKYNFAVGKYEVTRGEYAIFVKATGRGAGDGCYYHTGEEWKKGGSKSWRDPGYDQTDRDPVACINWDDAKAYVSWLSRRQGQRYRLLSEAEWEYVARAGSGSKYSFGNDKGALCGHGNGADGSTSFSWRNGACDDGYSEQTAPVGSFKANNFGLHDIHGNVWEWVADCWHGSYQGAPTNGSAWTSGGNCSRRVLRGGSWLSYPWYLRVADRSWGGTGGRVSVNGFRVARTVP